jgi:opacity protein-like surface antigen
MRKNIIRSILTVCVSALAAGSVNAQLGHSKEYVEPPGWGIGMNIGLADLWADVGTQKVIDHYANDKYWTKPHFMGGLFLRYSASPGFAVRVGGNYGTLYAHDNWNENSAELATTIESDYYQRYQRNLSVRTITWETYALMEITPRRFNYESAGAKKRFQPFIMLGVGYFHFKPTAKYIDRAGNDRGYVNLHELNVEATGLPAEAYKDSKPTYSLWQFAVPMGLGVRWDIGRRLAFGVEYLYRMTFTDYLDNVSDKYVDPSLYSTYLSPQKAAMAAEMQDRSYEIDPTLTHSPGQQRGNPAVKDAYSTFGFSLIFKVPSKKSPWWY